MNSTLARSIIAAAGAATVCLLATGLPASAAAGAAPTTAASAAGGARPSVSASARSHPVIRSFRASTKSLPSSGGTVRLTTAVKNGTTCTFSSSPKLRGLPAKVACSRGSATRTVRLPANSAAGQKTYKFGLTVTGRGGKAVAKPVAVVVREAAPAISQVALAPSALPSAGGPATLSATVSRSAKCTLSASPAVAGLPVTKQCAAGSVAAKVSVPLTLPAITGTTTKYTLTLTVSGPGGTRAASATGSVWASMKFSAPLLVDAPGGWLGTVSCASSTFCMGLDLASGAAERWNGTGWSAPVRIETGPYLNGGYDMHLSCASASFCLAVDSSGNAFSYNGTSWSAAASVGLDATAVSCASQTFCVATAGGQAAIFSGSAWSAPATVSNADQIVSLSCPSDSFCLAVSSAGLGYTYTTSGWSSAADAAAPIGFVQVSCASSTFCAAVTSAGQAYFYTGAWSGPTTLNASGTMNGVSCPAGTTFCMALADGSYYTSDNGTTWSGPTSLETGKAWVGSCASKTSCLLTDGAGVFVLSGSTWASSAAPGGSGGPHGFPYSVSCPTASFCVAVDWSGAYLTYNGTTWSAPKTIGSQASAVDSVSCTSPTFCLAVTSSKLNGLGGGIFIYNGHAWQFEGQDGLPMSSVSCTGPDFCEILTFDTNGSVLSAFWNGKAVFNTAAVDTYPGFGPAPTRGQVSCASRAFCVAVDDLGNAFTLDSNGTSWSKATALDPGLTATMTGVSCPTTSFCVAIDASGHQYTYNGNSWTAPTTIDSAGEPQAISCTTARFCLMGDLSGNVATFDGASWSAISNVDPGVTAGTGLTGASCADAAHCVAVDWEGNALVGTG